MELIILGLGGSVGAVLSHLFEFISQRRGRALSTIVSAQTVLRRPPELQSTPRLAEFRPRPADQKHVRRSEHCA
jgi:hypothetical protein